MESILNIHRNPDDRAAITHQNHIIEGGILRTLLREWMRPRIRLILNKTMDRDSVDMRWQSYFDEIIRSHYHLRYPERFKNSIDHDRALGLKELFPNEFSKLEVISQFLEEKKTLAQICYNIDRYAVVDSSECWCVS